MEEDDDETPKKMTMSTVVATNTEPNGDQKLNIETVVDRPVVEAVVPYLDLEPAGETNIQFNKKNHFIETNDLLQAKMSTSPNRKHVSFNADIVRTEVFGRRNEWKYQGLSSPP